MNLDAIPGAKLDAQAGGLCRGVAQAPGVGHVAAQGSVVEVAGSGPAAACMADPVWTGDDVGMALSAPRVHEVSGSVDTSNHIVHVLGRDLAANVA